MASNTTFGATIVPSPRTERERTQASRTLLDSPALTPAVSHDDMVDYLGEKPAPPHSPFYQHPPSSNEVVRMTKTTTRSQSHLEKDLESGVETPLSPAEGFSSPFSKNLAVQSQTECTMWPSKQTLKQQQQATKSGKRNKRVLAPVLNVWSNFTKRQRLLIKIFIALFVIGAAVGLGVGISVAVKGAYFTGDGKSQQVGVDPNQG